jgi:hypothetical protein
MIHVVGTGLEPQTHQEVNGTVDSARDLAAIRSDALGNITSK